MLVFSVLFHLFRMINFTTIYVLQISATAADVERTLTLPARQGMDYRTTGQCETVCLIAYSNLSYVYDNWKCTALFFFIKNHKNSWIGHLSILDFETLTIMVSCISCWWWSYTWRLDNQHWKQRGHWRYPAKFHNRPCCSFRHLLRP